MIRVQNLTKVYGETVAVDHVSFHVPQGQILGLLGPNGAGKTTAMRVLTGYTPPTSGRASVGGHDVVTESREARRILGYLPENAPVYGEMTVRGFLGFFAETKGFRGAARRAAVDRAVEECGLEEAAERLLGNLSKGYRQRAALAQAVVGDPKALILDEPTVGLDPKQVRDIRSLIRKMADRRTVILSTHILPEVSLTCTRVAIIDRGRIVASGTPDNVQSDLEESNQLIALIQGPQEQAEKTLADVDHVRAVQAKARETPSQGEAARESDGAGREVAGARHSVTREYRITVAKNRDVRASLSRAVVEGGLELLELRSVGLSLEDVFIHTITRSDGGSLDAREGGRDGP